MGPSNQWVFGGVEKLLICCPGCSRSPGRPSDWIFREAVKLLSCVKLFSGVCVCVCVCVCVYLSMDCGFCFLVCSQTLRGLSLFCVSFFFVCYRVSGRSADCNIWCPVVLCTEELLGWLQAVVSWVQWLSWDSPVVVSDALGTADLLRCLRMCSQMLWSQNVMSQVLSAANPLVCFRI